MFLFVIMNCYISFNIIQTEMVSWKTCFGEALHTSLSWKEFFKNKKIFVSLKWTAIQLQVDVSHVYRPIWLQRDVHIMFLCLCLVINWTGVDPMINKAPSTQLTLTRDTHKWLCFDKEKRRKNGSISILRLAMACFTVRHSTLSRCPWLHSGWRPPVIQTRWKLVWQDTPNWQQNRSRGNHVNYTLTKQKRMYFSKSFLCCGL